MKTSSVNLNTGKSLSSVSDFEDENVGAGRHSRLVVSCRVNPLSLVEITLHVVRQMTGEPTRVWEGPVQVLVTVSPAVACGWETAGSELYFYYFYVLNLKIIPLNRVLVGQNQSVKRLCWFF